MAASASVDLKLSDVAAAHRGPMTKSTGNATAQVKQMLADLSRLIEALDRRVPHLERLGEARIAREAAELRERAASLIQQLEGEEVKLTPTPKPPHETQS